jgi:hypothetical protein
MEQATPAPLWRRLVLPGVCLLALVAAAWAQLPDGRLRVQLLPAPGDAVLVQTPAGRFVLIDGGRDPSGLALLLGRNMPFWRRDLLAVVLTDGGGRRLPGQVAALARYGSAIALAPPGLSPFGTAGEWRRLARESGAAVRALRPGQRLDLDGATLTVLGVTAGDGGGAVLLVTHGATRVLVHTGGPAGDEAARAAGGPLDLLLYPWQRQLDTALVAALRPRAIAFTAAYEAEEPALLSYADRRRFAPRIYHPANDGAITLASDGRNTSITTSGP